MSLPPDEASSIPLETSILNDIIALSGRSSAVNVAMPLFELVATNDFCQSVSFDEAYTSNAYL